MPSTPKPKMTVKLQTQQPRIAKQAPRLQEMKARRWDDRARGTSKERGYGHAWTVLRAKILKRDGWQCQECKRQGRLTAAMEVDHITNKAIGGDDHPSNLQALCKPCHSAKTKREAGGQQ